MILEGKATVAALEEDLKERLAKLKEANCYPTLAVILAGDSKPSEMYADFMMKVAKKYGISAQLYQRPEDVSERALERLITSLGKDDSITGILMMLPLPKHIDQERMISLINPDKDADGLTSANLGRLTAGKEGFFPCTPTAVMAILDHYKIDLDGKHAVVIGRSNVVGKPMALLLLERNCTVTICHSHTKNLAEYTRQADILVSAVGKANYVTADMVKPGATVIDVGINRVEGKTVGDVKYDEVAPIAGNITPVPGGVGAVTTRMVIESIVKSAEKMVEWGNFSGS